MHTTAYDHVAVTAHFLAGDHVELTTIDGVWPADMEPGEAEYYRSRAVMKVSRQLKKANPSTRVYVR